MSCIVEISFWEPFCGPILKKVGIKTVGVNTWSKWYSTVDKWNISIILSSKVGLPWNWPIINIHDRLLCGLSNWVNMPHIRVSGLYRYPPLLFSKWTLISGSLAACFITLADLQIPPKSHGRRNQATVQYAIRNSPHDLLWPYFLQTIHSNLSWSSEAAWKRMEILTPVLWWQTHNWIPRIWPWCFDV
jgi:hypothetical protein